MKIADLLATVPHTVIKPNERHGFREDDSLITMRADEDVTPDIEAFIRKAKRVGVNFGHFCTDDQYQWNTGKGVEVFVK
jgi:hypothetical protein